MNLTYLTLEQAIQVHKKTVELSGGGALGHLDLGKLDSVFEHIQNDDYYPTFESKLTHLFYCTNKFHSFEDGNKRMAISLSAQFLLLNGRVSIAGHFIRAMENISYHVARGKIDKDFLEEIIASILNNEEDNENLKLRILNAIDDGDKGK